VLSKDGAIVADGGVTPAAARALRDNSRRRERVVAELTTTFAGSHSNEVCLEGLLDPSRARGYARQATGSKYLVPPQTCAFRPHQPRRVRSSAMSRIASRGRRTVRTRGAQWCHLSGVGNRPLLMIRRIHFQRGTSCWS
jgi:hypothetical protein